MLVVILIAALIGVGSGSWCVGAGVFLILLVLGD